MDLTFHFNSDLGLLYRSVAMTMLRRIICCSFTVNNHFHEYGCGYDVGPASAPPPQHWTATNQCCKARHDSNQHGRIASDQATPTLIPTIWQGPQGQYRQCQCAHCANKLLAPVCKGTAGPNLPLRMVEEYQVRAMCYPRPLAKAGKGMVWLLWGR